MIFCSYNTRGLNNKVSFYRDFITTHKLGLVALLETHVQKENATFVSKLVAPNFEWLFNYDHHLNGRIWLGWNPRFWSISEPVFHSQHISCKISSLEVDASFFATFIYASNDYIERRLLWNELVAFKDSYDSGSSPWIVTGDFNVCLNLSELNRPGVVTIGMQEFNDCVDTLDIFDLNFSGKFYTWWDCNHENPSFRKLDRALVNEAWLSAFSLSRVNFMPRGLSDHSPAMIYLGINPEKLHRPFQLFQHMIDHADFLSTVETAWNAPIQGDPWYILSLKTKKVKDALKRLNKSLGNIHDSVVQARNALSLFQENIASSANADAFLQEAKLCEDLHKALHIEEVFLKQKSRVNWLELGDSNNSFFHRACKGRWNTNKILVLEDINGNTFSNHQEIAGAAIDYFKGIMGTNHVVEQLEANIELPSLSEQHKNLLNASFSRQEILAVLKNMAKGKSPGPDGMTPEFYIAAWHVVGDDVTNGIMHFFNTLELPRVVNSAALTLVPKVSNPSRIDQFRPISCCNTLYKCISKLLAGRLQKILPSIISCNQSAFVPNRLIGDNIMLVQALCKDYHRNDGIPRCAFKLDIHKAFDSLNWEFLFASMEKMGFPVRYLSWIKKCITSCMLSVKINGVLEGFFPCKSGLRQGDPLSPFLFVLSMEVLTAFLSFKLQISDFSYHWRTQQMKLSHVIFADDIFLFCKGDSTSIKLLLDNVIRFSDFSGLKLNKEKCLGFFSSVPENVVSNAIHNYGFSRGSLPISYLGLPLITSRLNAQICSPLIQRMSRKIASWTVRCLRYSGRLQLINSVLHGIQGYWTMYLFLPKGVLKRLQSLFAKFLWGGSEMTKCQYKVAWSDCCLKREEGGLGIRDLFEWNKAAIFYQIWRIALPSTTSLWILWIHTCLLRRKAFWTAKLPYKCSWILRKIFNHRIAALQFISYKVKDGSLFKAWHDPWLCNRPLIERFGEGFPSLMDTSSDALVGSLIVNGQWNVSSSNDHRAITFRSMLSSCEIDSNDKVLWDGHFPVKLGIIWDSIRRHHTPPGWVPLLWNKFHVPCCSFITWLAFRDRLLTKDRMNFFQMPANPLCVLCRSYNESAEHLFMICPYTYIILRACPFGLNLCWNEWMQGNFFQDNLSGLQKCIGFLYISVTIYLVWRERNDRIHDKCSTNVAQLGQRVKHMVREKLFTCRGFKRALTRDPTLSQILF